MAGIDHYTKLMLHCDGANGGTVITDSSSNNRAVSTNGGCVTSTSQAKFGATSLAYGGTSVSLISMADGGSPYLDMTFGTLDFTIDFWAYYVSAGTSQFMADWRPPSVNGAYPTINTNAGNIAYIANSTQPITGGALPTNVWTHIAVTRAAGSTKLWMNGVQQGSTYADATNYLAPTTFRPAFMNDTFVSSSPFTGFMDEIRVSAGIARWNAAFTPPNAPYNRGAGGFWI